MQALENYFDGKVALFEAFRRRSRPLLAADLRRGDEACKQADLHALRIEAHNLKSVLTLLGEPQLGAIAAALEATAAAGRDQAFGDWPVLRQALSARLA